MPTPAPTPMDVQSAGRVDIDKSFGLGSHVASECTYIHNYIVETLHVHINT